MTKNWGLDVLKTNRFSTEISVYKNEIPKKVNDKEEKIKSSSVNFM